MTDYDPGSIPILDDVIEIDEAEKTELDELSAIGSASDNSGNSASEALTPSLFESEPVPEEHGLDLFVAEATDSVAEHQIAEIPATEDTFAEEVEPQIGIIDDINDDDFSTAIHSHDLETAQGTETVATEAAINEDNTNRSTANSEPETDGIESALIDYGVTADVQPVRIEQQITEQRVSLETVVDGITRQLMPDLEQQLRFLIQQALEDSLPDEVIKQLTDKHGKPD